MPITQSEMDALATMANGCLLPIVNNPANSDWEFLISPYDKTVGILPGSFGGPVFVSPQPNYAFLSNPFSNLIPALSVYDGSGNYTITTADAGDYDYIKGANDTEMDITEFNYTYTTKCFWLPAGKLLTFKGTAGQPVTAKFSKTYANWLNEFNRIRGDAMAVFMAAEAWVGGEGLAQNPAAVCSGPWCVGVNDLIQYPMFLRDEYKYYVATNPTTVLHFDLHSINQDLNGFLLCETTGPAMQMKNVQFICSESDATGLNIGRGRFLNASLKTNTGAYDHQNLDVKFTSTSAGELRMRVTFWFASNTVGPYSATPPALSGFTLSATPSMTTSWSTAPSVYVVNATGYPALSHDNHQTYKLICDITLAVSIGETDMNFDAQLPAGYGFETYGIDTLYFWELGLNSQALVETFLVTGYDNTSSAIPAISGSNSVSINCSAQPSDFAISFKDGYGTTASGSISAYRTFPYVKGAWVAKTLPVPGMNVFLDQDFPPYIGVADETIQNIFAQNIGIATAGNGQAQGQSGNPYASTMRQTSPISFSYDPTYHPVYLNDKVQSMSPGITCRPAKWLARRDTDFVPFELGFNSGLQHTTYSNQIADAAGDLIYYSASVPPNATSIKIRLVQSGTVPGWRGGVFEYGVALAENLNIFVRQIGYPILPVTYDFLTTNNAVTIDPDGGGSYLAAVLNNGFNFAVQAINGHAVTFDVYVEIDTATPARVYFPLCAECFSYVMDGTPGVYAEYLAYLYGGTTSKPVPQSGYCIFKVRATRLPVGSPIAITPTSGAALTITIGQNILAAGVLTFTPFLNPDSSNLTITIPADARDSGDVKVFIPVLAGNEIVYQCSTQIIFEAWVNWQPVWFNKMYGMGQFPLDIAYSFNAPTPTVFQYALSFVNDFNVTGVGWPKVYPADGANGSAVQFPLFRELYDDTVELLKLLGGVLPTGNQAAGAGGTGSAGGGVGSGGGAGGGAGGGFGDQL